MMSGIRSKNTRPELLLRSEFHKRGLRFKLHERSLPGNPDLVFPKHRAILQVNGCFWHGHNCHLFKLPKTRTDFWQSKISSNFKRDQVNASKLKELGWRVGVVWECATKGKTRLDVNQLIDLCENWIKSGGARLEIIGK